MAPSSVIRWLVGYGSFEAGGGIVAAASRKLKIAATEVQIGGVRFVREAVLDDLIRCVVLTPFEKHLTQIEPAPTSPAMRSTVTTSFGSA